MLKVEGDRLTVETKALRARFEAGVLVSFVRVSDGREFLDAAEARSTPALELTYPGQGASALSGAPGDKVTCRQLNALSAEYRFEDWYGDGVLAVAEDPESGDLVLEPSGYASRPGLQACRWNLAGIGAGLTLVAPFFQGVKLDLEDPLIAGSRWAWPHSWEAGLAILEGDAGGFWVHCRDDRYRFKALRVGADGPVGSGEKGRERRLGFETEATGPLDRNLAAGGLAWRLNVYGGDWRVPAGLYRDWLRRTYQPRSPRPDWLEEVRFAVSWCPCQEEMLEALSAKVEPGKVLLHVPNWRSDPYDENYPTFRPSAEGRRFIEQARAAGFRVMPHMNSVDMDPTHPVYPYVRDFQYREVVSKAVQGWTWVAGKVLPVPESNAGRLRHRDKKTMVKIHPGLAMWRSILAENVAEAASDLGLDAVFLDVTLCAWNTDNGVVEYQTTPEGMRRLIAKVAGLGCGLTVGGEGRNEVTAQELSFAQVHLFRSWQSSLEGLERTGGCPLNEFLFAGLCRSFGYSGLNGATPESALRMRTHVSLGAIPTVTVRSAKEIAEPNEAVAEMLALTGR
jgi:hypothetical protein